MTSINTRLFSLFLANLLGWCVVAHAAETASQLLPAEVFFEPPSQNGPKLSPDGTKVGILTRYDATHNELTLMEPATKKVRTAAKTENWSVVNFWWKTNDLILMIVEDGTGDQAFRSLDLKTGKLNELNEIGDHQELALINTLSQDRQHSLFVAKRLNSTQHDVIKVNLNTGRKQVIERDPDGIETWFINREGAVLAGWGRAEETRDQFLLWRNGPNGKWQRRWVKDKDFPDIIPLGAASDGKRLIVADYRKTPKGHVSYYDPVTNIMGEEIVPARDMQPYGLVYWGNNQEQGAISYATWPTQFHFLNEEMKKQHEWLEKKLPGTGRTFYSFSQDNSRDVIVAYTDRNPGIFLLADFATQQLVVLASLSKTIKPAQMAPIKSFSFKSKDGLTITGVITLPVGSTKPPAILRINGLGYGQPATTFSFDQINQFFASRGYATIEINHRGTGGFGRDFTEAGDFQINTGMVQDMVDGIEWIKTQALIDDKNIAVFGQFSGNLIAFPLAAKPGLFKALINFESASTTDHLSATDLSSSDRGKDELNKIIGGQIASEKYATQLAPLKVAEQINIPSFNFYSRNHLGSVYMAAHQLRAVFKKRGVTFELFASATEEKVTYDKLIRWKEQAELFEAVTTFLDQHVKHSGNKP